MGLKYTRWGATELTTGRSITINPALVRYLRSTADGHTEVWFAGDHCITIKANHQAAADMLEPEGLK